MFWLFINCIWKKSIEFKLKIESYCIKNSSGCQILGLRNYKQFTAVLGSPILRRDIDNLISVFFVYPLTFRGTLSDISILNIVYLYIKNLKSSYLTPVFIIQNILSEFFPCQHKFYYLLVQKMKDSDRVCIS